MKMLADQAELPYETVKKLLGGKIVRPSFVSVWQIAAALECSLDELSGYHLDKDTTSIPRWLLLNRYSRRAG